MDLFIMMVSKGIAYRFEQITKRIKNLTDKVSYSDGLRYLSKIYRMET